MAGAGISEPRPEYVTNAAERIYSACAAFSILSILEFGVFDAEMTALLRAVLEKVCENIPVSETGAGAYVASKLLDAASHGQLSTDALKAAGRKALNPTTMWR